MSLFHYTNINALHSILSESKIWLTDIRYLNDSKELHDGVDLMKKVLNSLILRELNDFEFVNEAIKYINHSLNDSVNYGISEEPVFIFSLGKAENRLSQWRSYGNYAIEFDEEGLKDHAPALYTCNYDIESKKEILKTSLIESIKNISNDMAKYSGNPGVEAIDAISYLMEVVTTFKDDGFFEEQEVRIVDHLNEQQVKYRVKDNLLIPYLEMEISLDCIKRIHIGPMKNKNLAYESMLSFVKTIEREWQIETDNIEYWLEVVESDIPYREL